MTRKQKALEGAGALDPIYKPPAAASSKKPRRPTAKERHLTKAWAKAELMRHLYADDPRLPECQAVTLGKLDIASLVLLHDRAHFKPLQLDL